MSFWEKDAEENEEEAEEEEEEFKSTSDRILFLLDARQSMLEANAKGESHLKNCLQVILSVMKTKIVAQDASSVGLTFFGSREKDSSESTEGVFTLFPLAPPSAQRIRQLQEMINDMSSFDTMIGSQPTERRAVPLKQALWTCSQSFAAKDLKKNDLKRIWLFTNDDQPNDGYPMEQKAIVTVARDCAQAGIEISLFHLNRKDKIFDPTAFYTQLLVATSTDAADSNEVSIDHRMLAGGYDGFDSLMASVRRKEYKKRRLSSFLFQVGHSNMAVQLFKTIQVAKRPTHTWLYAKTNEPLKSISKFYEANTGETLDSEQIQTYVDVAGSRVLFTKEEMTALKQKKQNPEAEEGIGMKLLFCIGQDEFEELHLNLDTPYFLYPDERSMKGAGALFEALLRESAAKKVIPFAKFAYNKASLPRMAALIPQLEEIDEDGIQLTPPGFYVIPLPFAEEVRYNPLAAADEVKAEAGLVSKFDKLIHEMTLPEDFDYTKDVENPALQQFYSILQGIALNASEAEFDVERDDKMRPPPTLISDDVLDISRDIKYMAGLSDDLLEAAGSKRKKADTGGAVAKKVKAEAGDGGFSEQEIKDMATAGTLAKRTVADLKEMCKVLGLPVSGAKADLVARVTGAC